MFRNYLAAALRNLARNRLYAAINIIGLGVGISAALLVLLMLRDQLTYERFLPGVERIYQMSWHTERPRPGRRLGSMPGAAQAIAGLPGVEATARFWEQNAVGLRHGDVEARETIGWADPDFFRVLAFPAMAGDLNAALRRPDGLVLTRAKARKFFGRDAPIGETLEFDRAHAFVVMAVLKDLPANSDFKTEIITSGLSPLSPFAALPDQTRSLNLAAQTYVRLDERGSIETVRAALPGIVARLPSPRGVPQPDLGLIALADVHLRPDFDQGPPPDFRTDGPRDRLMQTSLIGLLILVIAAINFVTLSTAVAGRRAIEVGVRKTSGAARHDLVLQFIGEALFYSVPAVLLVLALLEFLLPQINGLLGTTIRFEYWRDRATILLILGAVLLVASTASAYPAFVLSEIRPATVLRGSLPSPGRKAPLRQGLVTLQFAILVGLLISTLTIHRQQNFATAESLRFDRDQMLLVESRCQTAFRSAVAALPGVRGVACSQGAPIQDMAIARLIDSPDGGKFTLMLDAVDPNFFRLHGIAPLAGRLLSDDHSDTLPTQTAGQLPTQAGLFLLTPAVPAHVLLNETAVRQFGLGSPSAAIGKLVKAFDKERASEVVGVVPDLITDTVERVIGASAYAVDPNRFRLLSAKLTGRDVPETLQAIDQAWMRLGEQPRPITRYFLDEALQRRYSAMNRQGRLMTILSGVAVFVAALGLFGLAAFTAERRTKEIGIRKAMGAGVGEILRLLLWQFAKPVLWANLIAWPAAFFVMRRWLQGFAYHIDLAPWMFLAAGGAALAVALLTVAAHSLLVARTRPVMALRYE